MGTQSSGKHTCLGVRLYILETVSSKHDDLDSYMSVHAKGLPDRCFQHVHEMPTTLAGE